MRFKFQEKTLTVIVDNPRSQKPQYKDISELLSLPEEQIKLLLTATQKKSVGTKFKSQIALIDQVLRPFAQFLKWCNVQVLPSGYIEWQYLISQFAVWQISHEGSQAKLETRCSVWRLSIRPWIKFLIDEGVIPYGVVVTDLKLPPALGVNASPQSPTLIGEAPAKLASETDPLEKTPINNTLAGPIFWRTDAEYLDEIETILRQRDSALREVLDDYWLNLVRDYRSGRKLIRKISDDEWKYRTNSKNWISKSRLGLPARVTSPEHPQGAHWALRLMQFELYHGDRVDCLTRKALQSLSGFKNDFLKSRKGTPHDQLLDYSSLSLEQENLLSMAQLFYRFLGVMNGCDMAVAIALLIREHPNLNPEALAGAKLLNAQGKCYLLLTDNEDKQIFSVDKPRAKSRKYAGLTHRACRVLKHVLRVTDPVRKLMKNCNIPQWRYLFLGLTSQGQRYTSLGHPSTISAYRLHDNKGLTLSRLYPSLTTAGLVSGTIDFVKIRNTQGVLAWFNEGSVHACAKRLGNSEQVSLKHYIPPPLLHAWNERIIRRFQNTLISLAAHDEDYLLEVMDMPTIGDLHNFLAQLVYEYPEGKSPIADEISQRFGARYRINLSNNSSNDEKKKTGLLHLRISPDSLAYLIAYRQWALDNLSPTALQQPDTNTGRTPRHFIDLAKTLQAAANDEDINDAFRQSHDIARLKRAYHAAIEKVPEISRKLANITLHINAREVSNG